MKEIDCSFHSFFLFLFSELHKTVNSAVLELLLFRCYCSTKGSTSRSQDVQRKRKKDAKCIHFLRIHLIILLQFTFYMFHSLLYCSLIHLLTHSFTHWSAALPFVFRFRSILVKTLEKHQSQLYCAFQVHTLFEHFCLLKQFFFLFLSFSPSFSSCLALLFFLQIIINNIWLLVTKMPQLLLLLPLLLLLAMLLTAQETAGPAGKEISFLGTGDASLFYHSSLYPLFTSPGTSSSSVSLLYGLFETYKHTGTHTQLSERKEAVKKMMMRKKRRLLLLCIALVISLSLFLFLYTFSMQIHPNAFSQHISTVNSC